MNLRHYLFASIENSGAQHKIATLTQGADNHYYVNYMVEKKRYW